MNVIVFQLEAKDKDTWSDWVDVSIHHNTPDIRENLIPCWKEHAQKSVAIKWRIIERRELVIEASE